MSPRPRQRKVRRVFVSYSREGGQGEAVSLYQGLVQVLGDTNVFLDVGRNAMEAGVPWKESVAAALAKSDALLLVLDPGMAARLNEPGSAVLFELESAQEKGVRIACVRVGGAEVAAAGDLPPALGGLADGHSPQVHADAAVAGIESVIKDLTGRVPGQVPAVDRWDLTLVAVLAILGAVAWLSVGSALLNLKETWLWGAALVMPWLLWMGGRRTLAIGKRGRATVSYRQAASWMTVLMVFGGAWTLALRAIYPPTELAEGGILVSRLADDPSDQLQKALVGILRRSEPAPQEGDPPEAVAALPSRIGFASLTGDHDGGHARARHIGSQSHAAVVLWGRVLAPLTDSERLALNLTFIDSEALYRTRESRVVGAIDAGEVSDLDGDLDLLATTLPRLLDGYRDYRAARNERELGLVDREFSDAIETLEVQTPEAPEDRRALKEILASLHFFRGNTRHALGRRDEAIAEYQAAVRLTGGVEAPLYVEAASNLGWLLSLERRLDEAIEVLTNADPECDRRRRHRACAYAWYNLGDAHSKRSEYVKASEYFQLAMERLNDPRDDEERLLSGYAQQYLAYTLVRRAAATSEADPTELLGRADAEWRAGVNTLEHSGLNVPSYFRITLARIHIEQQDWGPAIEILKGLDVPLEHQGNLHGLLAGAYSCLVDLNGAETHLNALFDAAMPSAIRSEGLTELKRIKKACQGGSQAAA